MPRALAGAIEALTHQRSMRHLRSGARSLSEAYRAGRPEHMGPAEVEAYVVGRVPATYAAVLAALEASERRVPIRPQSLIDAGAGPGTAAWAATTVWPMLETVTLLDANTSMIEAGRRLGETSGRYGLTRGATWVLADVSKPWQIPPADVVVAAYALGELPPERVPEVARRLWAHTRGILVLVEPGTPRGFQTVQALREDLIGQGATTVAPCPHDQPCPLEAPDWCHFAERVPRSRLIRQAKEGRLPYEDEKFAYAVLSRVAPARVLQARVLERPEVHRGHVRLKLCTPGGIRRDVVSRSDGERYRSARKAGWGSEFEAGSP